MAESKPKRERPPPSRRPKKEEGNALSKFFDWFLSWFRRGDTTPVTCRGRMENIGRCHFRGVVGFLVPLFALSWQGSKKWPHITVQCMWLLMLWFFLLQPVSIPATSFIPIFLLPMTGVLSSVDTCQCYINENILLFVLTGMLILCLNNSGYDRRFALWFIKSGDNCQFGGKSMIFKCCTAAFFLSMISSRLIAASSIIQYVTKPLMDLQDATSRASEPCYDKMRYILVSATSASCAIGSVAIMHAAPATLAFRTLFHESGSYPDIFNYLQYSAFAFPTAVIINLANIAYHMLILSLENEKPMSPSSRTQLRNSILKYGDDMPKIMTTHELLTVIFVFFYLIVFFTRWCKWLNMGWASYSRYIIGGNNDVPGCMDATTAAIFVVALHTLPKGFSFWPVLCERKKSKVPPLKRESAILWWRYVDRNLNYAYMFLIGSGVALTTASDVSGLSYQIAENFGKTLITGRSFEAGLFVVCLLTVILANIMPGVAGLVIFLPFVIAACQSAPPVASFAMPVVDIARTNSSSGGGGGGVTLVVSPFMKNYYLCALAVGVGSSFGFMSPFMYTPAYFTHKTGKVPKLKMAKYGFGAAVLSCLLLWMALLYWAPGVWDPKREGISMVVPPAQAAGPTTTPAATTTQKTEDASKK